MIDNPNYNQRASSSAIERGLAATIKICGIFPFILFFAYVAAAQVIPHSCGRGKSGGVINNKAVKLVIPESSLEAKAAGASGRVIVQVTVNETGDIISAAATKGNSLLYEATVAAARQSKFRPAIDCAGLPYKTTGVIVYDFPAQMSWLQIGFEIVNAEMASEFSSNFPTTKISAALPNAWNEEKLRLRELLTKQAPLSAEDRRKAEKTDHAALLLELKDLLKNRLAGNVLESWYFEVGLTLGKVYAQVSDDNALPLNLIEVQRLAATMPPNVFKAVEVELKKLASFAEKHKLNETDKAIIETTAERIGEMQFDGN